jgi:hypothetical protein
MMQAIASVPGHPLLIHVIKEIVDRYKRWINTTNEHFVHEHTGPGDDNCLPVNRRHIKQL